jgi:hypothetical protein
VTARFNPPPGWPAPPQGWTPPAGWQPDPSWPAPPAGWSFWVEDRPRPLPAAHTRRSRGPLGVVAAVAVAGLVVLGGVPVARALVGAALASDTVAQSASATAASLGTREGSVATSGPAAAPSTSPRTTTSAPALSAEQQAVSAARPGTALAALAAVRVAGRAPKTGYDRARFGQAWADVDRNGCDTRNDVLRRDLTSFTLKAGTRGCLVLKGTLHDPYTGRTIAFVRGQGTSNAVQIDHVVALSDAWQKGAQSWSTTKRTAFANDSLNLLAVDGPTNARKGDGDAATWLPPAKSYRCAYVARQEAVKLKYGLWMTRAERAATARVLTTCPAQRLPAAKAFRLGGGTVQAVASPAPSPEPATQPSTSTRTDPRFGTCREAKSHGYGPYYSGRDPEYAWYQDRDQDGIVCE